ncbi:MAG: DUF2868 domain-containing protein, partial [Planctomycetota bacterium]
LSDLFDLEVRTLEERGDPEEVRRTRYRSLGRRVLDQNVPSDDPAALLRAMVRLDPSAPTPGDRFQAAFAWFQTLLAVAGALFGATLSLGLLHYGGPHPVNILNVLALLVGVQLALLLLLFIALFPRDRSRVPGPVQGLLRMGLRWIAGRLLPQTGPDRLRLLEERLDSHRGLLRWMIVRAAQLFGVCFNLGALAGCAYRIVFSDVAFGWSTTLHLEAGTFHQIAQAMGWAYPPAVPTGEVVALTQYSHLEGKYLLHAVGARSANPSIVGGWWPFLLLSLATYGLLPRLAVFGVSAFRVRRILDETPERNEEFRRLVDWMRLPVVSTLADPAAILPPSVPAGSSAADPDLPPPGTSCELRLEGAPNLARDVVERRIQERFGWTVSTGGPLLVVLSAWEEPTKGNQRLFQNIPAGRLVVVGLLNPSSNGDPRLEKIRDRWRRYLQGTSLRLRVESL